MSTPIDNTPVLELKLGLKFIAKGQARRKYQVVECNKGRVTICRQTDGTESTVTADRCRAMIAEVL